MSSEGWSNSVMADAGGGSRGTHKHTTHVGTLFVPYPSIPHSSCRYPHVIISCLICPRVCTEKKDTTSLWSVHYSIASRLIHSFSTPHPILSDWRFSFSICTRLCAQSCTSLTAVAVRGLGKRLTLQPPWASSEIPGDIRTQNEWRRGQRRLSCDSCEKRPSLNPIHYS